jgi:hypothetical protein
MASCRLPRDTSETHLVIIKVLLLVVPGSSILTTILENEHPCTFSRQVSHTDLPGLLHSLMQR